MLCIHLPVRIDAGEPVNRAFHRHEDRVKPGFLPGKDAHHITAERFDQQENHHEKETVLRNVWKTHTNNLSVVS